MPHPINEPLEPRRLLAGLTLIVPDAAMALPSWVPSMSAAIARRADPLVATWTNTSRFRVHVGSGKTASVDSFALTAGPTPKQSSLAESIVELDWSAATSLGTAAVAQAVSTALQSASTATFGSFGAVGQPIHLIGDGRGASIAAELARLLGNVGIGVDQTTFLDPAVALGDSALALTDNIAFADSFIGASAAPTDGANNVELDLADVPAHTYYHATIARGATTDGDIAIDAAWFADDHTRATSGFATSRLGGSPRPAAGVGIVGGGTATRSPLNFAGQGWPHAEMIAIAGGVNGRVNVGSTMTFHFRERAFTFGAEIDLYLDTDHSLTTGFNRFLTAVVTQPAGPQGLKVLTRSASCTWSSFNLTPGVYTLTGVITNGTKTQQVNWPLPLVVDAGGVSWMTKHFTDDLGDHNAADPRNFSPGGAPTSTDRALFDANATLPVATNLGGLFVAKNASISLSDSINAGVVQIVDTGRLTLLPAGNHVLTTKQLSLSAAARIDLTDNAMVVDYAATSPLAALETSVKSARAAGTWIGPGIGSSTAAAAPGTVVAIAEASDVSPTFATNFSVAPDTTAVILCHTFAGDADLDGTVSFPDLVRLAQHYGQPSQHFSAGDFDYDGDVDFDDLVLLAQNYGRSLPIALRQSQTTLNASRTKASRDIL
jgi:hypothetical protein